MINRFLRCLLVRKKDLDQTALSQRRIFYYDYPNQEYFAKGTQLFHRINGSENSLFFTFDKNDSAKPNENFEIISLLAFSEFIVLLIDWQVSGNIICIRKDTDELVWRIKSPPNVLMDRSNYWTGISKIDDQDNVVCCHSINRYKAYYQLDSGIKVEELMPDDGDIRDFNKF